MPSGRGEAAWRVILSASRAPDARDHISSLLALGDGNVFDK
jgi:hypothetical protein